jgi:hypothetical protein
MPSQILQRDGRSGGGCTVHSFTHGVSVVDVSNPKSRASHPVNNWVYWGDELLFPELQGPV